MGTASSSTARLSDTDSHTLVAANDAYGSLAGLATRPKPKKKPVLVLDADELAEAHLMFQQGAAEQLEDAEHVERAPISLGLAPLGSDAIGDDTPDEDEDEYTVEADAPAPEDVLNLTQATPPAAPAKARKQMIALPPEGDPAFDNIAPFEAFSPLDSEEVLPLDDDEADALQEPAEGNIPVEFDAEPKSEPEAPDLPMDEALLDDNTAPEEPVDLTVEPVAFADNSTPAPLVLGEDDVVSEPEIPEALSEHVPVEPAGTDEPADAAEPIAPTASPPAADLPPPADENFDDRVDQRVQHFADDDDDAVDGYAFMRGPERANMANLATAQKSQNSLRSRLVREEDLIIEEEPETLWARFASWVAERWRNFLG